MKATLCRLLGLLLGIAPLAAVKGQTPPGNTIWVYTLVNGSQLTEDCPVCDHVTAPIPMRGTFQLRALGQGPLFSNYAVENIAFQTEQTGGRRYKVSGRGTFRIGGEIGVQQDLILETTIDNGLTNTICELTNATPQIARRWPMFQAEADQTNGTLVQQYRLDIRAAPFREIWFSTLTNFHASIWNTPSNAVSGGDLLASSGRIVKGNHELTGRLGIQPLVPDLGLKDIDILPGGEIAFSIEQSVFSETLGMLLPQDLLSDGGRVVRHANPDLIGKFQPTPLPHFVGLDAVQVMDDGQVYFSVQKQFGSGNLGVTVQPGDLLSDDGTMVKSGSQLLAAFNPTNVSKDYGLKSVFVWPSSEVWFSTRDGFFSTNGSFFGAGDLLSDQGYLVYSNAELLASFEPLESPADLGLDALFVVSDVAAAAVPPAFLSVPSVTNQPPATLLLQRNKGDRVFQLEASTNVLGPYLPIGPITTDTLFTDPGVLTYQAQRFYRLQQW